MGSRTNTASWRIPLCAAGFGLAAWAGWILGSGPTRVAARLGLVDVELLPIALSPIALSKTMVVVAALAIAGLVAGAAAAGLMPGRHYLGRACTQVRGALLACVSTSRAAWTGLEPAERRVVLIVAGLGIVARAALATLPVSWDESTSYVWFASRSWWDVVSDYSLPNNHVAQNLGMWFVTRILGATPFAIRLPALIAGVVLLPATFAAFSRLTAPRMAAAAMCVVAVAPPLVEFSAQGRGYMPSALFLCLALAFLTDHDPTRRWGTIGAASGALALALWSVPTAAIGAAVLGLWLVLDRWRAGSRAALLDLGAFAGSTAIVTVGLYAPILARSGLDSLLQNQYVRPRGLATILKFFSLRLGQVLESWVGLWPVVVQILAVLILLAVLRGRSTERSALRRLLLAFLIAVPSMMMLLRVLPPRRVWTDLAIFPLGVLGAALVAINPARRWQRLAVPVCGALAVIWLLAWGTRVSGRTTTSPASIAAEAGPVDRFCCREGTNPEARDVARVLAAIASPDRPLVTNATTGQHMTIRFYLRAEIHPIAMAMGYDSALTLDHLAPYPEVLFLADTTNPTLSVARQLTIPQDSLDRVFLLTRLPQVIGSSQFLAARWRVPRPDSVIQERRSRTRIRYPW